MRVAALQSAGDFATTPPPHAPQLIRLAFLDYLVISFDSKVTIEIKMTKCHKYLKFKIKFYTSINKLELTFLMDKSNEVYCKNNKLQEWFRFCRCLCLK